MIQILIVDDHPMVGLGTKNILEEVTNFDITYLLDSQQVIQAIKKKSFDIYLLDINMPNCSGIELSKKILNTHADAKIIFYTGFDYSFQFNTLIELGIYGIISKSASYQVLVLNIQAVLNGYVLVPREMLIRSTPSNFSQGLFSADHRQVFSQKELDILGSLAKGSSNKEIADELFMSIRAVEYNLTKIYKKLCVTSRSEAVAKVLNNSQI
ncbi:response regulator transcription factor [Lysinibacillus parviboronicapiens]|uniref:response regulator transcription factor n=1 Tax=Lysinibacillus parviboronicapiens TaxID=436516 RepID=UPI000D3CEA96|nr:response regulator transcription factor [Lysinibacillus parviboronicapiens]